MFCVVMFIFFFLFKQKTAYEMRISDWSSDVCSSDLPEEIAEVVPESDKVIRIEAFLPCPEVDTVYFDKPYYLAPPDGVPGESFAVLREGMRRQEMAALARAVLFRSAERRVGNEWVSKCTSRWSAYPYKKNVRIV